MFRRGFFATLLAPLFTSSTPAPAESQVALYADNWQHSDGTATIDPEELHQVVKEVWDLEATRLES